MLFWLFFAWLWFHASSMPLCSLLLLGAAGGYIFGNASRD